MRRVGLFLAVVALPLVAAPQASSGASGRTFVVRMTDGLQFAPAKLTIQVGERVVWKNVGGVAHTVTTLRAKAAKRADAVVPRGARAWDSGFVFKGERYTRTFKVPGLYRYFCIPHEGARMIGTITVRK